MQDEMGYQNDMVKRKELGVFLSDARISGEILQQELNSMLPVSILAAFLKKHNTWLKRSNLRFLDLCAAPGSKTCQLLTTLNNLLETNNNNEPKTDFTVVANELMSHRASRTRSRCCFQGNKTLSHLIVTVGDGRQYGNMGKGYFDFVICDVPCSGDGTIRKSPEKLGKWTIKNAESNKPLQKDLLKAGLDLLKPTKVSDDDVGGGVLLYSTCSLNPLENDDVILEVLQEMNENSHYKYEIVSLDDISTCQNASREQTGNFLRVLPEASHGGFFVAALRKTLINNVMDIDLNDNPVLCKRKDDLIWAHNKITAEETLAYAISPSTWQCCIDLSRLRDIQLIGCGVPALYKSNNSVKCILQEGCSCFESDELNGVVPSFSVTQTEFVNYFNTDLGHLLFPLSSMHKLSVGIRTRGPCIVKLSSPSANGKKQTQLLLPAKILRADHSLNHVTVEIAARPQIFKRAFHNIDLKNS
jgi:16S rRNA C967 or C1407 C5-methylase (RsmB/RsmF family)